MPDTLRPGTLRRLRFTPLTDLLRGRITGRLDVTRVLAGIDLPAPALDVVRRVVRRTRLWRAEQIDVAAELAAHFADGLEAGATVEELVAAFGDEKQAARLIRRAKIRNRPLAWHAARNLGRFTAVLLVVYAALAARFYLGEPTVSVDYLAKINTPTLQVPEDRRAWPLYRQALAVIEPPFESYPPGQAGSDAYNQHQQWLGQFATVEPGSAAWGEVAAWLDRNAAAVDLIRQAAARPDLGFVFGPNGSQREWPLNFKGDPDDLPLLGVLMPNLNRMRRLAEVLTADLRLARELRDGGRVVHDVEAMLGMAEQVRSPFLVNQLVGIGITEMALDQLDRTLTTAPGVLNDAALIRIAHLLATVGEGKPLVDLSGERMFFYDLIQRTFTDDGQGDGRITPRFRTLGLSDAMGGGLSEEAWEARVVAAAPLGLVASRREQLAEYDRLMDLAEAQLRRPARETDWLPWFTRMLEIKGTGTDRIRYLPIAVLMPSLSRVQANVEMLLARRDAIVTAVALDLYCRRHGAYPESLTALVSQLLPAVPVDRITGEPLRYKLQDGRPLLYSVGADRDDDGGRVPVDRVFGNPSNHLAADWPGLNYPGVQQTSGGGSVIFRSPMPAPDGDWMLYPEPQPLPKDAKGQDH